MMNNGTTTEVATVQAGEKNLVGGKIVINRIGHRFINGYVERQYHHHGEWKENGRLVRGIVPKSDKLFMGWTSVAEAQEMADQFNFEFVNRLKQA